MPVEGTVDLTGYRARMTDHAGLLRDAFHAPGPAIGYVLNDAIARAYPDRYVMRTQDHSFDLDTYLVRHPAEVVVQDAPRPEWASFWAGPGSGVHTRLAQGHRTLDWEGSRFDVIEASWVQGHGERTTMWWVGPSRERVEAFAAHVAEVASEVREEVLVFAGGGWQRSQKLRDAIRAVTFDSLVLEPGRAEGLLADFQGFLAARDDYRKHGAPWKRGVLFLGPPGNGKTHAIKALLNALELPCLYVQSFEAPHMGPQEAMSEVFERARRTTPCALVLEDLDALVTPRSRSYFLNELDGFADNEGILTLATTNHPERLDPALLNRPSRFDRKYAFDLPQEPARVRFLALWNERFAPPSRLTDGELAQLAARSEGFSYAYLKELMLSTLVAWMSAGRASTVFDVAAAQVEDLREQMASAEPVRRKEFVPGVDPRLMAAMRRGAMGGDED